MKSDFNERRENRQAKYEELSNKNNTKSTQHYKSAKAIGDFIPMGQPVLVGHHSEGRHRRDLNRIDSNMRKSVECDNKAKHYAEKARTIDNDTTIYSDDPEAVVKLKEKIASLEKKQQLMKSANKIIKGKKPEAQKVEELQALGLNEKQAISMLEPDYCNRIGFASYLLTNNNANINRNKKRLVQLVKANEEETTEFIINGVTVIDSVEDNRLQLFFDGKPNDEVRTQLKSSGFRWSRYLGCWQRHRSYDATYKAKQILNSL